ncbi:MAG TPA: TVP38/TMEM64 family protein [Chloroflexia bacterium]|nr:TVP38/TMEM64 family protein [Chloroflexia bacterium]
MKRYTKIIIGLALLLLVIAALYFLPSQLTSDWLGNTFSSAAALKEYILSFGPWAPLIFFLIQFVQVIVSPIPGSVTTLAGGALFGAIPSFLLSGSGTVAGSLVAFYLARIFGQKLVSRLVGKKIYERYNGFFSGKFVVGLFLMFIFPFFPDDALCLLAGLSTMRLGIFLLLQLLGRLPGVFLTTLVGSGVINLSLWQWIILGLLSLVVAAVYLKYSEQFENWLDHLGKTR